MVPQVRLVPPYLFLYARIWDRPHIYTMLFEFFQQAFSPTAVISEESETLQSEMLKFLEIFFSDPHWRDFFVKHKVDGTSSDSIQN